MASTIRKLIIVVLIPDLCPIIIHQICLATDTISMNEQVVDGQTIVSAGGIFELGFFSPNRSKGRYVGIWYKGLPTEKVAWVANRERPLIGSNEVLMIESDGNLVLVDHDKNNMPVVWSTQLSLTSNNTIIKVVLTDEGNLVLRENKLNESVVLWESFNHPSDALLPRMKIGLNTRTGEQIIVTSWKDDTNPSLGSFTIATVGSSGTYSSGAIIQMDWDAENNKWLKMQVVPKGQCDLYNTCGPFGSCKNNDSPICKCFKGYEPKSMSEWNKGNWISGCVRRAKFQCEETSPNSDDDERKRDVFLPVSGLKLPDFSHYLLTWDKMECQDSCLENCSCLAYAYVDGIGCMIWGKDLIDLQELPWWRATIHSAGTFPTW
ncbi:G-type lectin S-receptor-like serine/threonine-protein kinase At1g61400 [Nicotiana tabacum]|uniref:G-type lectin S-receptor-like serine/threonine-protein kinase At1g61400 n=1 Tax=Nicotiana tabacum TaxID=4097 RepID=A0A1S4C3P0_TOBAC